MGLQDEVMARVRSQQDGTPATEAAATSNEPFKVTDMSFLYNTTNDNYGDKFAGKFKPQRTKMCKLEAWIVRCRCVRACVPGLTSCILPVTARALDCPTLLYLQPRPPMKLCVSQVGLILLHVPSTLCSQQRPYSSARDKPERATQNGTGAGAVHGSVEAGNKKRAPHVLDKRKCDWREEADPGDGAPDNVQASSIL